jgi:hypothetical protein
MILEFNIFLLKNIFYDHYSILGICNIKEDPLPSLLLTVICPP